MLQESLYNYGALSKLYKATSQVVYVNRSRNVTTTTRNTNKTKNQIETANCHFGTNSYTHTGRRITLANVFCIAKVRAVESTLRMKAAERMLPSKRQMQQ